MGAHEIDCITCDGKGKVPAPAVTCNRCGESRVSSIDDSVLGLRATVTGCYGSTTLEDMHTYRFQLCEKCLVWLFEQFKVSVDKSEYHFG